MAHFTHCAQARNRERHPVQVRACRLGNFLQEKNGRTKIELRERGLLEQREPRQRAFENKLRGSICKPSGQETSPKNSRISRSRGIAAEDDRQLRDGFQREPKHRD